uniref:Uncharacterized protein n=1 Tax=Anguilla anguilla TaxID=7936 RepID=A0A0E9V8W2_ANGAN
MQQANAEMAMQKHNLMAIHFVVCAQLSAHRL